MHLIQKQTVATPLEIFYKLGTKPIHFAYFIMLHVAQYGSVSWLMVPRLNLYDDVFKPINSNGSKVTI